MTIFNKISGLAQKAKDNVVSKTVLSMDKRLEHSLSDNINTQTIAMKKVQKSIKWNGCICLFFFLGGFFSFFMHNNNNHNNNNNNNKRFQLMGCPRVLVWSRLIQLLDF
jgi:hypothetical protein